MKKVVIGFLAVCVLLGSVSSGGAAETRKIGVISKQYEFIPETIEVMRGDKVKLYVTSTDVTHGLAIPAFGVDSSFEKGELTVIEFVPDKVGEFEIKCSVFCGIGHRGMRGTLIVGGYKDITAKELKAAMKNKDFFLLDVHVPEQKHIEGTDAFIHYKKIEENANKLPADKNTKIIVYCRSGPMGDDASAALYKLGYKNVYNLKGGINAWNKIK
jgi:rhodanese-related sulfurtransferase